MRNDGIVVLALRLLGPFARTLGDLQQRQLDLRLDELDFVKDQLAGCLAHDIGVVLGECRHCSTHLKVALDIAHQCRYLGISANVARRLHLVLVQPQQQEEP